MTPLAGGRETGPWHRHRSRPRCLSQERGAGTVLALGVALVVIMGAALLLLLAQSAVAASRAAAAADLAALAAADAARGITPGDPCAVARAVALKNNAAVRVCSQAPDASVQVHVELNAGPLLGVARGLARAGPPPGPAADSPPGPAAGPPPG
jgi:secretion/DNA translocation related TadE-like protein